MPDEIAELRELLLTAIANTAAAQNAHEAATDGLEQARDRERAADRARAGAEFEEDQARQSYIAALRSHGYVQTADGPKPAGAALTGGGFWCSCNKDGCRGECETALNAQRTPVIIPAGSMPTLEDGTPDLGGLRGREHYQPEASWDDRASSYGMGMGG